MLEIIYAILTLILLNYYFNNDNINCNICRLYNL